MSGRTERLYAPLFRVLRLNSYWTVVLWGIFNVCVVGLTVVSGLTQLVPFDVSTRVPLDMLMVFVFIWAIRAAVRYFEVFFGIVPPGTKERDSQPRTKKGAKILGRRLFKNTKGYKEFCKGVEGGIFHRYQLIFLVVAVFGLALFLFLWLTDPMSWSCYGIIVEPWTRISTLIGVFATICFYLLAVSSLPILFGHYYTVHQLGKSKDQLGIWKYIEDLRSSRGAGDSVTYANFYMNMQKLGRYTFKVNLALIVIAIIGVLRNFFIMELPVFGSIRAVQWLVVLVVIPLIILLFLLPQLKIHEVLRDAKDAVVECLEEKYGFLKARFVSALREKTYQKSGKDGLDVKEDLRRDIDSLHRIIQETRRLGTWSFGRPVLFGISLASLVPTIFTVTRFILEFLMS